KKDRAVPEGRCRSRLGGRSEYARGGGSPSGGNRFLAPRSRRDHWRIGAAWLSRPCERILQILTDVVLCSQLVSPRCVPIVSPRVFDERSPASIRTGCNRPGHTRAPRPRDDAAWLVRYAGVYAGWDAGDDQGRAAGPCRGDGVADYLGQHVSLDASPRREGR